MKYTTKSVVIGRKKRKNKEEDLHPCFIALFDINDPHRTTKIPKELIDYEKVFRIFINGLDIKYMLPGSDIVINNLEYIKAELKKNDLFINGKQKK